MAAFGQSVEQFIDTHINGNLDVVKIATNDEEMNLIWESLYDLESGGFGTAKVNYSREYVVKQINIGRQIERKGHMYAINNVRNEVLIYHYIAQKCVGVCSFIGCYYDKPEKLLYVKSKYCGDDLHTKLFGQLLDFNTKLAIFGKIIDNLKCLHDNGVVYRDLKPENITISADNTVTFIDFGLSYLCEDAEVSDELKMNQDRNIIGTMLYADPTRPIPDDDGLKKTDTYSLGVLFAFMFSKQEDIDFLINAGFKNKSFMYRVGQLTEAVRSLFWTEFNEKVKKILGDEIDNTRFFGGFDIRLTSEDLQYAFKRTQLLDYQRSINHNVTRAPSKLPDGKSFGTSRKSIVSKIKPRPKLKSRQNHSSSLEGGNNKTKRHRKTRGRKNYQRK
jgi:serine/threonine protein kinase